MPHTSPPDSRISDPTTLRRLYGRGQGHRLTPHRRAVMERLYPLLSLGLPEVIPGAPPPQRPETPLQLDPGQLFAVPKRALWLEIGFGGGEHLAAQAQAHPDVGFIGCEPFLNGMARLLDLVDALGLANVRVHRGDALDVLEALPDASLGRVFLLHPDPWPKARHAKRRFINPGPLDRLAARLEPGGELRVATDHPVYMEWTLMQMQARREFEWLAQEPADWQQRPADWPATRYGRKAERAGKPIWYLRYRRTGAASGM